MIYDEKSEQKPCQTKGLLGETMRIAILTSFKEDCTEEDYILSKSFAKDGHKVDLLDFPAPINIKNYDLILLKNAWLLDEKTYRTYFDELEKFTKKIKSSNCKLISSQDGNLNFDKNGKKYLVDLFEKGYNVVPTIDNIKDIDKLPVVEKYIKKPYIAYDGFDMEIVNRDELKNLTLNNEVLQPKLKFISEVQLYFINNAFQYALEYTPSKWPDYPTPHEFKPPQKYIDQAKEIIELNNASCSFNRVDFLRLNKEEMMILEFADTNPNLSLPLLTEKTLNKFLKNFKQTVYDYISKK